MSSLFFPTLTGLGWPYTEEPNTSTRISHHVSLRETRNLLAVTPIYSFELVYDNLLAGVIPSGGLDAGELQILEGFFTARQGQFDTFFVKKSNFTQNINDSVLTNQFLGTGNGSNTTFTFVRPIGPSYVEPVGWIETSGLNVYLNGVLQTLTTDYTVSTPSTLTFITPPGSGVTITADYTFYFVCRFQDPKITLSTFLLNIAEAKSIKLITVKP